MPAGYASHTGYQYDSISRVAGQRELAPPSNLSKEGGCRKSVFKGIRMILTDAARHTCAENSFKTAYLKSTRIQVAGFMVFNYKISNSGNHKWAHFPLVAQL